MRIRFSALGALIAAASCAAPSPTVESRLPSEAETAVAPLLRTLREGDIVARESAMEKLVELGPDALPALRLVQASEADGDVVGRLRPVIEELEEQDRLVKLVGRPRLVELHGRRLPIQEAFQELARQSGIPIVGEGLAAGEVVDVKIQSAPIWEAVDALCELRGDLCPEWSADRVTIRPGPFRKPPSVDWRVGPIPMGRLFFEYAIVAPEWLRKPVLEARVRLLLSPGTRLFGATFFLDEARDEQGKSLFKDERGTVCLQDGNGFTSGRSIMLEIHRLLFDTRLPSGREIRNSRGTLYFDISPGARRLALMADFTPEVWRYPERESPVSTYVQEFHRARGEVRIKYLVTFPMMSDQHERIVGPSGVRLLTSAGEAIYPRDLLEQNGGGSMGATDWFYEARFVIPPEASLAGLEVLRPAEPSAMIRIEYDFPRLPVHRR